MMTTMMTTSTEVVVVEKVAFKRRSILGTSKTPLKRKKVKGSLIIMVNLLTPSFKQVIQSLQPVHSARNAS